MVGGGYNRIALVGYSSSNYSSFDAWTLQSWTQSASAVKNKMPGYDSVSGGTNSHAGLIKANELLKTARPEAKKFVIFLSDGEPTYHYEERFGTLVRRGDGSETSGADKSAAYDEALKMNGISTLFTVGVGASTNSRRTFLMNLAGKVAGGKYFSGETEADLIKAFDDLAEEISKTFTDVKIEDTLSKYVDMLESNPRFTITAKDENDHAVSTSGITANYNKSSKKVTLDFPDGYSLKNGVTYTVSFKVKPSQEAYKQFLEKGTYPSTGDQGTGTTSAGKKGFYSNDRAVVTYKYNNQPGSAEYKMPVVQVETTTVSGQKTWEDYQNAASTRPENIVVKLMNGSKVVQQKTVTSKDQWKYSFVAAKYDENLKKIDYKIKEENVPGYTTAVNGNDLKNTIVDSDKTLTSIEGIKSWSDYGNKYNTRPDEITVKVMDGERVAASKKVTAKDQWKYKFTGLKKYRINGDEIRYTVKEELTGAAKENYTSEVTGYNIRNTLKEDLNNTKEIEGTKSWSDYGNRYNTRPDEITVKVMDGEKVAASKKVTAKDQWKYKFTGLAKYRTNGDEIRYTVKEELTGTAEKNYTSEVTGYNIKNTLDSEKNKISLSGKKTWNDHEDDSNYTYKTRPESITVNLLADGKKLTSATVKADDKNQWNYTFENLERYTEDGKEIKYTVTEEKVPGYEPVITGMNILNKLETTSVTVKKTWKDGGNDAGLRPEGITLTVYNKSTDQDVRTYYLTGSKTAETWTETISGLPKLDKDGKTISYGVREEKVKNYKEPVYSSGHLSVENEAVSGKFTIQKTDKESGRPLSGAKFTIYKGGDAEKGIIAKDMNGNKLSKITEKGQISFEGIMPGEYYMTEDKLDGYLRNNTSYKIKVTVNAEGKAEVAVSPGEFSGNELKVTNTKEDSSLEVSKKAEKNQYVLGETIKFEIVVRNTGNTMAKDIVVKDSKLGFETTIAELEPGKSKTIHLQHKVTAQDVQAGAYKNVVVVSGKDSSGNQLNASASSYSVIRSENSQLSVSKNVKAATDKYDNTNYQFEMTLYEKLSDVQEQIERDNPINVSLTLKDSEGKPIEGKELSLYKNEGCTEAAGYSGKTDKDGVVTFEKLKEGTYYTKVTDGQDEKIYRINVKKENDFIKVQTAEKADDKYQIIHTNNVQIKTPDTVEGPSGEDVVPYSLKNLDAIGHGIKKVKDGVYTFNLKNGETLKLDGLKEGVYASVKEIKDKDVSDVSVAVKGSMEKKDEVTAEGRLNKDTASGVIYTNTYYSVKATKQYDIRDGAEIKAPKAHIVIKDSKGDTVASGDVENGQFVATDVLAAGTYTVEETPMSNFETAINGEATNSYKVTVGKDTPVISVTVTNTYVPKAELTVTKEWTNDGNGNEDKFAFKRPSKIDIALYKADGTKVATAELNAENNWKKTFEKLNEKEGYYVVEESPVSGYTPNYKYTKENPLVLEGTDNALSINNMKDTEIDQTKEAKLEVEKTADSGNPDPLYARPGDTITYRVVVKNAGTNPIKDVDLKDTLNETELKSTVYKGIFKPGETIAELTYTYKVPENAQDGDILKNVVIVKGMEVPTDTDGNYSEEGGKEVTDSDEAEVTVEGDQYYKEDPSTSESSTQTSETETKTETEDEYYKESPEQRTSTTTSSSSEVSSTGDSNQLATVIIIMIAALGAGIVVYRRK